MHSQPDGPDSSPGFARLEERREPECAHSEPLTPLTKGFTRSEGRLGMLKEKEEECKRISGSSL